MTAPVRSRLLDAIEVRAQRDFGQLPSRFFFAPGRINLCGAHLDYSGGDVLPMAVDRGIFVGIRPRGDGRIRLRSVDQELAFDVRTTDVGDRTREEWGWGGYPLGIWRAFATEYGVDQGFDAVYAGDVPIASGLSSSAAIEVVTAIALNAVHGTGLEPEQIAAMAHRAENDFVGVRCGIMDQYASALGRPGQALLVHCAGPRWEHVPFDPAACEVLVMDTRKPRKLATSGFNRRVEECREAHELLRKHVRDLSHLAAYDADDLAACRPHMPEAVHLRARHVVSEMGRIAAGVAALRRHDYAGLGMQIDASHRSTATDYAVSCEELDVITDAARSCEGVYGARLTGAGFGGCAIALIAPGRREQVAAHVAEVFRRRFDVEPGFDLLRIGEGPGEIGPGEGGE
ncbi:MAG: galactokinase [Planctomycetota bacterium]